MKPILITASPRIMLPLMPFPLLLAKATLFSFLKLLWVASAIFERYTEWADPDETPEGLLFFIEYFPASWQVLLRVNNNNNSARALLIIILIYEASRVSQRLHDTQGWDPG